MIYDMSAHLGPYQRRGTGLEAEPLARLLASWDVERAFAGRIDVLFQENVHQADRPATSVRVGRTTLEHVPVIDPTLPDWPEFLGATYRANGRKLPMVRVYPSHHGFALDDDSVLGPLIEWTHHHGTVLQVVQSLDDARRRHPAQKLQDVPLAAIVQLARRFAHQKILASGGLFQPLAALGKDRPANLWADTARVEAAAAMPRLFEAGWGDRLVFASFAPILIYHSAIARILSDLNDADAAKVLRGNALALVTGD